MFAVVKTGGKQYRIAVDDIIKVEKLAGVAGDKIKLDSVLMVGDAKATKIGTPFLDGTAVSAEILEQIRADKIIVFKKKKRKNYRRTQGHRQYLTVLKILDIGGAKKAKPAAKAEAKAEPKAKPEAKAKPKASPKVKAKKPTAAKAKPKAKKES